MYCVIRRTTAGISFPRHKFPYRKRAAWGRCHFSRRTNSEQLLSRPVRTCEIKKSCHSINKSPPPLQLWEQLVSLALITQSEGLRKLTRRPQALWCDSTSSAVGEELTEPKCLWRTSSPTGKIALLRRCSYKAQETYCGSH